MLCPTCSFFLVSVLRFWNVLQHFFTRIGGKAISIVLPLEFWAQLRESLSSSIHFPHFLTVSSHLMEFFDYCDPSSVYSYLSWGGAGLNAEYLSNKIIILQHGARTNKAEGPIQAWNHCLTRTSLLQLSPNDDKHGLQHFSLESGKQLSWNLYTVCNVKLG